MKTTKIRKARFSSHGFTFADLVINNATRVEERKAKKKKGKKVCT